MNMEMKKYCKVPICILLMFVMLSSTFLTTPIKGVVNVSAEQNTEERNLAYRRAGYQSSAYTANETVQLLTDGIISDNDEESKMAYSFSHQYGNESRYGNVCFLFDDDSTTDFETYHTQTWVEVSVPRKTIVKSYTLTSGNATWSRFLYAEGWTLEGSNDGKNFSTIHIESGQTFENNGTTNTYTIPYNKKAYTYYRLTMNAKSGSDRIHMGGFAMYDENEQSILAPYKDNVLAFVSAWMTKSNQEEWAYIDLGEQSTINRVKTYWGSMFATKYDIQISDDAKNWTTAITKTDGAGDTEEIIFDTPKTARYVKLLLKETNPDNIAYIVREFEVYGANNLNYTGEVDATPTANPNGSQVLSGGNWRLERALNINPEADNFAVAETDDDASDLLGIEMSSNSYDDSMWLPAIVPGTVLTSYDSAGALADPDYADQQFCISDSYFKSNFWYRNHFVVPTEQQGQKVWLNFEAINWKAEVYYNGHRLGNIRGAFTRSKFEVTEYTNFGQENYLAVLIYKNSDPGTAYISNNDHPGTMGGVFGNSGTIGKDAPTYSAALGWDWVPTVRDRAIGIYNDVFLTYSDDAQVIDPWVITTFDKDQNDKFDLTKANLTLKTEVSNTSDQEITTTVNGNIHKRSDIVLNKTVIVPPNSTIEVEFDTVVMDNPEVWWPNTYGEQPLYTIDVSTTVAGEKSDTKTINFGVREMTFPINESTNRDRNGFLTGENLTICCNGVRIICRGGNWGLEDKNLAADDESYDDKIRLHKEANFNMIRNWGGQTNDPALYESCDKYGILIWDDFFFPGCWLHSPDDNDMFISNCIDKIKNYRYHPSLALYCGANEMYPEVFEIEVAMRALTSGMGALVSHDKYKDYTADEDPMTVVGYPCLDGTRTYVPNSGDYPLAIDGPHQAKPPKFYFNNTASNQLTTERGMPNIPVEESMRKIFPEENLWPVNDMWALHDFAQGWNTNGRQYMSDLNNYGSYDDFNSFVSRAQMQGYELHKAMFQGAIASNTNGLLMWMSNPAWPSLMWQAYDYFYDVNGGYFGIKTACQAINLIWNPNNNNMIIYNATPNDEQLKAVAEVYNLDGELVYADSKDIMMESDTMELAFQLQFPGETSKLQFIKTYVENENSERVGEDFYWNNIENYQDYTALADLENAEIKATYTLDHKDESSEFYKVRIENTGEVPALSIRLKVLNELTKERVLPTFYEDNYFSLMPGESKEVMVDFKSKYVDESAPLFQVEGWNTELMDMENSLDGYTLGNVKLSNNGIRSGLISPGQYIGSVDIEGKVETEVDVTLINSLYRVENEEEVFIESTIKPFNGVLSQGEKITVSTDEMEVPNDENIQNYIIKSFVWDNIEDMRALKKASIIKWAPKSPASYLPRNIALGSAVIADYEESGNNASNATDGNTITRWTSSSNLDEQNITVDLGDVRTFSSTKILWESAYGKAYDIEVSSDGVEYTKVAERRNWNGGTDSLTFNSVEARYVRLHLLERGTGWTYSIYELEIGSNTDPSVAMGAIVTASAYDRGAELYTPDKIVDCDMSSRWATLEDKDNQWILIDMQKPQTFSSCQIDWEAAYAAGYTIEISDDNQKYTPLITTTNADGGTDIHSFEPVTARYVKINLNKRGTGWGYSIYEFSLYN